MKAVAVGKLVFRPGSRVDQIYLELQPARGVSLIESTDRRTHRRPLAVQTAAFGGRDGGK